jgi:hypothetical protein
VVAVLEKMSAWEQLRDEVELDNSDTKAVPEDGPTGAELLQVLDRIPTSRTALEVPEARPAEADWP